MGSCISHQHSKHHKGLSDDRIHHLPPINGNHPDAPSPPPPPPPLTSAPPSIPATFDPPIAYPYNAPQAETEVETETETETGDIKMVAGGNQNMIGEQEVEAVEVGNTSGDGVSSIFKRKGGNIDIQIGNNINKGDKQKIGKISIGNAISAGA